jgi:hypothetical protein
MLICAKNRMKVQAIQDRNCLKNVSLSVVTTCKVLKNLLILLVILFPSDTAAVTALDPRGF